MLRSSPTPILALMCLAPAVFANSLTDVGVGAVPDFAPARGTDWSMSSSCVDINELGEAACQSRAQGPIYRCGFRGIKRCGSKVHQVYRWNGAALDRMSAPEASQDVPTVMNNLGDIAGYSYDGAVYPSGGGNGRLWQVPESPLALPTVVTSINDAGAYILSDAASSGGVTQYSGSVHEADGTPVAFPGATLRPFVIGNSGEVVGAQIIQTYLSDLASPTGDQIPEVSGVGWLLTQADVDALELNEAGLYDLDGDRLWPAYFYRPMGFTSYSTTASDINDHGDFVFRYNFGGLYSGAYCSWEGESQVRTAAGGTVKVPWKCLGTEYAGGTYAGGKAFHGINNHGDAVGAFTPGAYAYRSSYPTHPWVWLRNAAGGRDEYDVNDLLPADSDYTVVSVQDINDSRDIVGTCTTPAGATRGCIVHVTDPPVPTDTVKPTVRIDAPGNGAEVAGSVQIAASAWDDWSRIDKVVFKLGKASLKVDRSPPYTAVWDTTGYAEGSYTIKAIAVDNAGNRRTRKVTVTLVAAGPPPAPPPVDPVPPPTDPVPPPPAPAGQGVEGEGAISALGAGYVEVDGLVVRYDGATNLKLNDVAAPGIGMDVQYKGTLTADGSVLASDLEVN